MMTISNIQYPISNIQYPISNIQYPISNIQNSKYKELDLIWPPKEKTTINFNKIVKNILIFLKPNNFITVKMALILIFLGIFWWIQYRISLVEQGICLSEGRKLTQTELDKRFYHNLLLNYRGTDLEYGDKALNRIAFTNEKITIERLKELIKISSKNDKTIEENFGLHYIDIDYEIVWFRSFYAPSNIKGTISPSTQLKYEQLIKNKGTIAKAIAKGQGLDDNFDYLVLFPIAQITSNSPTQLSTTWWQKLRGYGLHERNIYIYGIDPLCCDASRRYLHRYSDVKNYYADKQIQATEKYKLLLDYPNAEHPSTKKTLRISTCGDIELLPEQKM